VSTTNAFAFASQTLPTGGVWFSVKGGLARKEHFENQWQFGNEKQYRLCKDGIKKWGFKLLSDHSFFSFQQHIGALNVSTTLFLTRIRSAFRAFRQ